MQERLQLKCNAILINCQIKHTNRKHTRDGPWMLVKTSHTPSYKRLSGSMTFQTGIKKQDIKGILNGKATLIILYTIWQKHVET